MLAVQSAHTAVTQGADLLRMFRKGAVTIKKMNLANVHTQGLLSVTVARVLAGILQLLFDGWCA